jgi:hypothetical protein
MSKKLTLRLDEDVIERAKEYASQRDTSVSQLVEDYFARLTNRRTSGEEEASFPSQLTPLTRRLLARGSTSEVDIQAYYDYLEEKHG